MIQTMHHDRGITLKRPPKKTRYSMLDVSKAVCVTAYVESMLDDLDRLVAIKNVNNKIVQGVRKFLSKHDHAASAYFNKESCLAMSNILTTNIDAHREKTQISISKKGLDDNHFILLMTYELNAIYSTLSSLYDSGSLVYSTTVKGLINHMNDYLNKREFTDKLNIHTKRDLITGTIEGFISECQTVFTNEARNYE